VGVVSSSTIMIGCDGPPMSISVEYSVVESVVDGRGLGGLIEIFDAG